MAYGWRVPYLVFALSIYMLDQTTKLWAHRRLRLQESIAVIPGFFRFSYAENTGIAFGQLQGGGAFGRWLLVALALVAIVVVVFYFLRSSRGDRVVLVACSLLLAGIGGNLTDRVRLGYVIDFIDLHLGTYHWPTFNVADAGITSGALLLIYDIIFVAKAEHAVRHPTEQID